MSRDFIRKINVNDYRKPHGHDRIAVKRHHDSVDSHQDNVTKQHELNSDVLQESKSEVKLYNDHKLTENKLKQIRDSETSQIIKMHNNKHTNK